MQGHFPLSCQCLYPPSEILVLLKSRGKNLNSFKFIQKAIKTKWSGRLKRGKMANKSQVVRKTHLFDTAKEIAPLEDRWRRKRQIIATSLTQILLPVFIDEKLINTGNKIQSAGISGTICQGLWH